MDLEIELLIQEKAVKISNDCVFKFLKFKKNVSDINY